MLLRCWPLRRAGNSPRFGFRGKPFTIRRPMLGRVGSSMGFVQRRIVKSVLWVVTYPKLTLAASGVLLLAAVTLAWFGLKVSTDQNDLFSPNVKFFADYLRFDHLFPENQATYVIVEPVDWAKAPPVGRWVDVADRIAGRLRAIPEYVKKVEEKISLA